MSTGMGMNLNGIQNKLFDRFFRKIDGVVWDLFSGKLGIKTNDGIVTMEGMGDDAQVSINLVDQFGMPLPAFAQNTAVDSVAEGDLIYGDKKPIGWVVEITAGTNLGAPVKKFVLMTPDGTRKSWVPPKVNMLGFESGVMVLRSLMNMLPGGSAGLGSMQNSIMPMMMMMGGDMDLDSIMPMLLFSQMGGAMGAPTDPAAAANPMANMMPMMMMMQMMKGGKKGGGGGGGFFGNPES